MNKLAQWGHFLFTVKFALFTFALTRVCDRCGLKLWFCTVVLKLMKYNIPLFILNNSSTIKGTSRRIFESEITARVLDTGDHADPQVLGMLMYAIALGVRTP